MNKFLRQTIYLTLGFLLSASLVSCTDDDNEALKKITTEDVDFVG